MLTSCLHMLLDFFFLMWPGSFWPFRFKCIQKLSAAQCDPVKTWTNWPVRAALSAANGGVLITAEDSGLAFTAAVRGRCDWGTGSAESTNELSEATQPTVSRAAVCTTERTRAERRWTAAYLGPRSPVCVWQHGQHSSLLWHRFPVEFRQEGQNMRFWCSAWSQIGAEVTKLWCCWPTKKTFLMCIVLHTWESDTFDPSSVKVMQLIHRNILN